VGETVNNIDWTSAKTPAYIFMIMIISFVVVMVPYTIFYDYVATVFYGIAIANGGDVALFNMIVFYWKFVIPFMFVIGMIIYAIVNSMRTPQEEMYG
jgi:uncharacterized protein YqfA (UPF0365 family)